MRKPILPLYEMLSLFYVLQNQFFDRKVKIFIQNDPEFKPTFADYEAIVFSMVTYIFLHITLKFDLLISLQVCFPF